MWEASPVNIKVRFFAVLKEKIGREEIILDWAEGLRCEDVLSFLKNQFQEAGPILEHCLIAINGDYAYKEAYLESGDEVALLPPVSGG